MNARFSIPLVALVWALSAGCSKEKHAVVKQRLKENILDEAPAMQHKLEHAFDGKMRLLGYSLEPKATLKTGQKVKLTLYWQPTGKVEPGTILFTEILDGSGEAVMNLDNNGLLRKGKKGRPAYPPTYWALDKVYVDQVTFKVPAKTNKIQIAAGLVKGGDRLPVTSGAKDSQNRGIIANIAVTVVEPKPKTPNLPSVTLEKLEPGVKIKLDGKLDEEAWAAAPVLGPFVDVKTGEPNKTFPVNAKARLLWNDDGLFVAYEVEDKNIVGGFKKGEKDPQLWTKDAVELMVDPGPEGDNLDYYEIQIGPQNLVFDSQFDKLNEPKTEPAGPFGHQDWSSNLKSAVVIDGTLDKSDDEDKGYTVEAMVPWKSFAKAKASPPALGDVWRLNLYAMQENGGVAWSPILGQGNFHQATRFGKVRFTAKGFLPPPAGSASGAPVPSGAPSAAPAVSASARGAVAPRALPSAAKLPAPKPAGSAR